MRARTGLIVLLVAFALLPTTGAALATYRTGRGLLEQDAHDLLRARADEIAASLDALNEKNLAVVRTLAALPAVRAVFTDATREDARQILDNIKASDASVMLVSIFDAEGKALMSTYGPLEGMAFRVVSENMKRGVPFVNDPSSTGLIAGTNRVVSYGAPVLIDGEVVGGAYLTLNADVIQDIARTANGLAGERSTAVVTDGLGVRIAHGTREDLIFKPTGPIPDDEIDRMSEWARFGPRTRELVQDIVPVPEHHARALAPTVAREEIWRMTPGGAADAYLAVARRLRSAKWTVFVRVPEDVVTARMASLLRGTGIAAALALMAAVVVAVLTSSVLTRRMRELVAAAEGLARGEQRRVPTRNDKGEIATLARTFNTMADAITAARAELEQRVEQRTQQYLKANEELNAQRAELLAQQDELQAQTRELEHKNAEIRRADALKSAFLANMSHELRTPLNSIIGFTELLLDEDSGIEGKNRKYLSDVAQSGRHLLRLINEILDLSKIEAGQVALERSAIDPRTIVDDAWTLVASTARKNNVTLEVTLKTRLQIYADAARLRQVLLNLFSNALKFTPPGSKVRVRVDEHGASARFTVDDDGPGVPADLAARLFQPFVQGDDPLTKKHGGTGLGLAICKRLVELHGGTIEVGRADSGGARFVFTIPFQSSRRAPVVPGTSVSGVVEKPLEPARVLEELASTLERPGRVLSIDDDPKVGELMRALLEPAGYSVETASTGKEGIDKARDNPPDVVLVDLLMPDLSGFEVLEALANDERTRGVPAVVLTAKDVSTSEREWLRKRAQSIAAKGGVTLDELIALLEHAVHDDGDPSARADAGDDVLIVDDNAANRELARALLEVAGVKTREVESGPAALAACREKLPRLVLLDVAMPGMDGFEVLKRLRGDDATRMIPVVALTAMAMRGDEERARTAGFDGYLTKPIERDKLNAELKRWL